jgi:2OG-Fe(II) oxygenase superfamily
LPALRLPRAGILRPDFLRRGFVVVPALLEGIAAADVTERAMTLIRDHGVAIDREHGRDRLSYKVVTGDRILSDDGLLSELYTSIEMLAWIRELTDSHALTLSPYRRSAININCLMRARQQYPWHRDAVPFTAILFLTSLPAAAGGELLIRSAQADDVRVRPVAGDLVVMDGTRCPHAVAPLTMDVHRVTVPMVYPAVRIERPSGLDEYLYAP